MQKLRRSKQFYHDYVYIRLCTNSDSKKLSRVMNKNVCLDRYLDSYQVCMMNVIEGVLNIYILPTTYVGPEGR